MNHFTFTRPAAWMAALALAAPLSLLAQTFPSKNISLVVPI